MVYRDGVFLGKTPMTMAKVSADRPYKLTLEKEGFETWEQTLTFEPGQTELVQRLKKKIEYGSIDIATIPPGLEVRVNGSKLKEKSPLLLAQQDRSKTYHVQVLTVHQGHPVVLNRKVAWAQGEPAQKSLHFDLKLDDTTAADDDTTADDPQQRDDAPKQAALAPKKRAPRPSRPDPETSSPPRAEEIPIWGTKPTVKPKGKPADINVWGEKKRPKRDEDDLPTPKNGYLSVKVVGDAVAVSIDGKRLPGPPSFVNRPILPGPHRIEVTFGQGGQSRAKNVNIKPGKTTRVAFP